MMSLTMEKVLKIKITLFTKCRLNQFILHVYQNLIHSPTVKDFTQPQSMKVYNEVNFLYSVRDFWDFY